MSDSEIKKNKGGRKKGTKNHKRLEAVHVPANCPSCQSTDLKIERKTEIKVLDQSGKTFSGLTYNRIVFRHAQCRQCPQKLTVRCYEML